MSGNQSDIVLIFANGEMPEKEWVAPYLARATAVIAADGGSRHVLALGRYPDVVIGDMDSLTPETKQKLLTGGTRFITHDPAKDETDLELALLYAVEQYEGEILLLAALGGRLDQTIANILLLAHPALQGRSVQLIEQYQRAWLVESITQIRGAAGDTVSLIPIGGDVHVTATTGLRWPLDDEILTFGLARGVSNVMTAEIAAVYVKSGCLLCIHTHRPLLERNR